MNSTKEELLSNNESDFQSADIDYKMNTQAGREIFISNLVRKLTLQDELNARYRKKVQIPSLIEALNSQIYVPCVLIRSRRNFYRIHCASYNETQFFNKKKSSVDL